MLLHLRTSSFAKEGKGELVPLYPYQSKGVVAFFFYGNDYKRQKTSSFHAYFGSLLFNWFNFWIILCAVSLCVARRILKLRRDGLMSSYIDVLITFIGGGNLLINHHRLEKWFFGTLLVSSIFLNAIGIESSLYASYVDSYGKIDTFEKLASINPPIYVSSAVKRNFDIIKEVLMYVFICSFEMMLEYRTSILFYRFLDRHELGPDVNFSGFGFFPDILEKNDDSFVYITSEYGMNILKQSAKNVRDFDVLEGNIGNLL